MTFMHEMRSKQVFKNVNLTSGNDQAHIRALGPGPCNFLVFVLYSIELVG